MTVLFNMNSLRGILFICISSIVVHAATQITIDDSVTDGSLLYFPSGWQRATGCVNDVSCAIRPNLTKAFSGTYTQYMWYPQVGPVYFDLTFEGTGIQVYFIVSNQIPGYTPQNTISYFVLDGKDDIQPFTYNYDNTQNFYYNQSVYANNRLPQSRHTLRVGIPDPSKVTKGFQDHGSWLCFDYAIVTYMMICSQTRVKTQVMLGPKTPFKLAPRLSLAHNLVHLLNRGTRLPAPSRT
ncbi:hypothetical protein DL96DRAFT_1628139 [Flagelloscypha sp. PMI_526]|nr:hypothetical protein DL96DRAFT_1628139 [Flagelloscypha sp. PMI_526]